MRKFNNMFLSRNNVRPKLSRKGGILVFSLREITEETSHSVPESADGCIKMVTRTKSGVSFLKPST